MNHYIALIHKDADSDFGVSFPDLPGCVTAGTSLDEARAFAEEALALHLAGLADDERAPPEPSSLTKIMANHDNRDSVAVVVPVKTDEPHTVRVNITLSSDVLDQIDAYAERNGMSRSGFMAYAAKRQMEVG